MKISFTASICILFMGTANAAEVVVPISTVNVQGAGKTIGSVSIDESPHGLVFSPSLEGLAPGIHGFHVHENPSCDPKDKEGNPVAALAAGGHLDPSAVKRHGTPWGDGHLGDLPALVVGQDGKANYPVLAPRLTLKDVKSRALIIHGGGDNYSDEPAPLGGGARIACGIIRI